MPHHGKRYIESQTQRKTTHFLIAVTLSPDVPIKIKSKYLTLETI